MIKKTMKSWKKKKLIPVIAEEDTIRVEHRHHFEYYVITKNPGNRMCANKEVDQALTYKR